VALGRVLERRLGILRDLPARLGDAGAEGEREILGGDGGLGRDDLDLPGAALGVVVEGLLLLHVGIPPWRVASRGRFTAGPAPLRSLLAARPASPRSPLGLGTGTRRRRSISDRPARRRGSFSFARRGLASLDRSRVRRLPALFLEQLARDHEALD